MQKPHFQLDEIIWEITGECKNHCKYCGSKEAWNEATCEDKIKKIAEAIAKFPPKEINLSGGDLTLITYDTLKYVIEILQKKKIIVKGIINPKSFKNIDFNKKLSMFDWVGISVNTLEELNLFKDLYYSLHTSHITVISNFNLENIFIFDQIKKAVKDHHLMWQIQYTVYNESENPLAIYNNDEAAEHFFTLISDAMTDGVKIIMADNMNTGTCGAGKCSIGILADGTVVPCLSMRSWVEDLTTISGLGQGNILTNDLEDIWIDGFRKQRFSSFACCKDHCKNKAYYAKINNKLDTKDELPPNSKRYPIQPPRILMYGVGNDQHTYVYAVPMDDKTTHIAYYAVRMEDQKLNNPIQWLATTTSSSIPDHIGNESEQTQIEDVIAKLQELKQKRNDEKTT